MTEENRPDAFWWFFGFLVLVLVLYAPVIGGKPFVDDWVYVFDQPSQHIFGAFGQLHPYVFYRPVPLLVTSTLQAAGGGSPVPIHLFQFVIHALMALLVARTALRLGVSRRGALVAGVFVAVTQGAAAAVGGYDTLSISLSTLLGTASLGWMIGRRRPGVAAACFAGALLCKESALGYLPVLALCALFPYPGLADDEPRPARVRRALRFVAGLFVIGIAYVAWRSHLGGFAPTPGEGVYNMNFGPGMLRNLAMLWFAALLPVSSVDVFTAVAQRHLIGVALGALAACAVLALALSGFAASGRRRTAVVALVAASLAVSPVLPLNRVSELYAYTLMPFLALLFGASLVRLESGGRIVRGVTLTVAAVVLIFNALAARGKAAAMDENGRIAERMLADIVGEMSLLPPGGTLALVEPALDPPNYSVFRVRSFLLVPSQTLMEKSGRTDVTLVRIPAGSEPVPGERAADREITLDDRSRVQVLSPNP